MEQRLHPIFQVIIKIGRDTLARRNFIAKMCSAEGHLSKMRVQFQLTLRRSPSIGEQQFLMHLSGEHLGLIISAFSDESVL